MAELTPIPSTQRPADPGYQPVSGYAAAAAITASLFVLILIALIVQSLITRRTVLTYEVLIVAMAGLILAFVARSHVRNSEGTRTGLRLATLAAWVCALGGAGFFAYLKANEWVLERESGRYADRFFNELKDGRVHHAYVYVVPPEERDRSDPNAPKDFESVYGGPGLAHFKNHELVRLIVRNGSAVELERTGAKDLEQAATGFQVTHLYRLTCPEGDFTAQLKLAAAESRRGGKTQLEWRIPADPYPNFAVRPDRISAYGRLVNELEQEGVGFGNSWLFHLSNGRTTLAHLMTTPHAHRQAIEMELRSASVLGGSAAVLMSLRPEFLPLERRSNDAVAKASPAALSFEDLLQSGFFRADATGAAIPGDRLARLRSLWAVPKLEPPRQHQMSQAPPDAPLISLAPDVITVTIPAELSFDSLQYAKCLVGVECRDPEVLAAVNAARERSAAPDDLTVSLRTLPGAAGAWPGCEPTWNRIR